VNVRIEEAGFVIVRQAALLAFDWTFPPAIPSLRGAGAKTQVVIRLDEPAAGIVRVRFAQLGWGEGEDWDQGYAYFDKAWDWVLGRIKESLEDVRAGTPTDS
jgi:hypothetical protein